MKQLIIYSMTGLIIFLSCNKNEPQVTFEYKGYIIDSFTLQPLENFEITAEYYTQGGINGNLTIPHVVGNTYTKADGSFHLIAKTPQSQGEPYVRFSLSSSFESKELAPDGYSNPSFESFGNSADYMRLWSQNTPVKLLVHPQGMFRLKVKNKSNITFLEKVVVKYVLNRKDTVSSVFVDKAFGVNGEIPMNSEGKDIFTRAFIPTNVIYEIHRTGYPIVYKTSQVIPKIKTSENIALKTAPAELNIEL